VYTSYCFIKKKDYFSKFASVSLIPEVLPKGRPEIFSPGGNKISRRGRGDQPNRTLWAIAIFAGQWLDILQSHPNFYNIQFFYSRY